MAILEIKKLLKKFGGLTAVQDLTMEVAEGEIHSLIGPNGAGKTTIFNLVSRILKPDEGEILFKSRNLLRIPPSKICALGIARTFQKIELFNEMTAMENVLVGCHTLIYKGFLSAALRLHGFRTEETRIRKKATEVLQKVGMEEYKNENAGSLPLGQRRLLELARSLASDPKLLLLDEPASGLNSSETEELMKVIRSLCVEQGITILIVEHDMRLVMEISDNITVLNHGLKIAEGVPEVICKNSQVIEAYLGSGSHASGRKDADR
jgi:branched-chain amino acid transport system ATP-binding protein